MINKCKFVGRSKFLYNWDVISTACYYYRHFIAETVGGMREEGKLKTLVVDWTRLIEYWITFQQTLQGNIVMEP